MDKIREILRYSLKLKLSNTNTAKAIGSSAHTVAKVLSRATKAGLLWPLNPKMSGSALKVAINPTKTGRGSRSDDLSGAVTNHELTVFCGSQSDRSAHDGVATSLSLAQSGDSSAQVLEEEGVVLRRTAKGRGDGVLTTRPFATGETVMVGFLIGALTGNDSHATQVGPNLWARHGGLGVKVNHSCDPNCGVYLNNGQAFDLVARHPISAGQELTFDYAMRNFTIDHFPTVCLCGAALCRGSVTGWKDLPAERKADYGELVAPYLHTMDNEIRRALLAKLSATDGAGAKTAVHL